MIVSRFRGLDFHNIFPDFDINLLREITIKQWILLTVSLVVTVWVGNVIYKGKSWPTGRIKAQGMVSYYGMILSVVTGQIFGFTSWHWNILAFSYLLGCFYIVPIRHRWIMTVFEKPAYKWIAFRAGRRADKASVLKVLRDINDEEHDVASKDREPYFDQDLNYKDGLSFLVNGLNCSPWPIWFLGINLIDLDYVRVEGTWDTPYLPTNDPDNPLAGSPISYKFKLWFKSNFWPQSFLRMSDADRAEFQDVVRRIVEGFLADLSSTMPLNEALVTYKFFANHDDKFDYDKLVKLVNGDPSAPVDSNERKGIKKRYLDEAIEREQRQWEKDRQRQIEKDGKDIGDYDKELTFNLDMVTDAGDKFLVLRLSVLDHFEIKHTETQELVYRILKHTGCLLIGFEMLDRNPTEEVQAEMEKLTALRTQIVEAKRQIELLGARGEAAGQELVAQVQKIKKDLKLDGMTDEEIMNYLVRVEQAKNASHVVIPQALANIASRIIPGS